MAESQDKPTDRMAEVNYNFQIFLKKKQEGLKSYHENLPQSPVRQLP